MLQGHKYTDTQLRIALAVNVLLQIVASISGNLVATWFGPVAIVGPIFFAAQLLANLLIFWIVLGLESFSKEMQIGTYVIVVSVILLIVNGPGPQDYGNTTFQELINRPHALIWFWMLLISMTVSGIFVLFTDLHKRKEWFRFFILLVARSSGFALNLTTGKGLALETDRFWLIVNIAIKILSGIVYTKAIVVQSTAVAQKVFVPLNAALIIFVNAMTGIFIWEDYNVMQSWTGYVCVFLLLVLGCSLLLGDVGLLQETAPETFLAAKPGLLLGRHELLNNLKEFGHSNAERKLECILSSDEEYADGADYLEENLSQDEVVEESKFESNSEEGLQQPQQHKRYSNAEGPINENNPFDGDNIEDTSDIFPPPPAPARRHSSNDYKSPPNFSIQTNPSAREKKSQSASFKVGHTSPDGTRVRNRRTTTFLVQPLPKKIKKSMKRLSTFADDVIPNRTEGSRQAWAELYGRSRATPRMSTVPIKKNSVIKTRIRWASSVVNDQSDVDEDIISLVNPQQSALANEGTQRRQNSSNNESNNSAGGADNYLTNSLGSIGSSLDFNNVQMDVINEGMDGEEEPSSSHDV